MKTVASVLLATMPFLGLPDMALALPHGGIVSKGAATLGYSTNALLIHQTTNSATFNWSSYVVKSGQTVTYRTPGSSSVSLNMVGGTSPTQIMGSVKSNGILEFMNANGIVFGQGSTVSAAGVMAFGSTNPWGTPTGAVSNAGTISASTGGTVALVGTNVTNTGTITAPGGTVVLAAGASVVPLYSGSSSSLSGVVTTGAGGVLDSGVISAETVNGQPGKIVLQGGMGSGTTTLTSTAVIDASAPNGGNGGEIVVNGQTVVLDMTTPLNFSAPFGTKGTISIDPTTTDVGTAAALEAIDSSQSTYLNNANVCILLTANINLGGYAWVPLGNGSSSANYFIGTFNGAGYVVSNYTITASAGDAGFIGYLGSGGVVKNLGVSGTVNGGSYNCIGGVVGINYGTVEYSYNTGSVSGSSGNDVGGVVGCNKGTVEYSYNTGSVSGPSSSGGSGVGCYIGGVVGNNAGTVEYSYNTGAVSDMGCANVGGVVGYNTGKVKYSYNTGNITGSVSCTNYVAGVVGENTGTVEYSYNTGNVSGKCKIGGIVGCNNGSTSIVAYTYNTGSVSSSSCGGGIVGNNNGGTVEYSYNTGSVSGSSSVGGVVGQNSGTVTDTYYNSSVYTGNGIGGGTNCGNQTVSGVVYAESSGSFGSATTMGSLGSFASNWTGTGFSTNSTGPWLMSGAGGVSYNNAGTISTMQAPILVADLPSVTATGNTGSSVYNGTSESSGYTTVSTFGATTPTGETVTSATIGPNVVTNASTAPTISGSFTQPTTQTSSVGYTSVAGTWTITPLAVTATATTSAFSSGGTVPTLFGTLSGTGNGLNNLSATWSTTATSSSPAGYYAINPTYIYSNGAVAGDFTITTSSSNATAMQVFPGGGSGSGGSTSGGSTGASSPTSPATSTDTISTKTFVPEVQTVEPLMVKAALPIPAGETTPAPSAAPTIGSATTLDVASGGSWSLGYSLPTTPVNMTADLVSAEPVETGATLAPAGSTGTSSLTQQK